MSASLATLRRMVEAEQILANNEREMQARLGVLLKRYGLTAVPEHPLTKKDRLDFWLPAERIVIEVKMWSSIGALLRQLKRYADHPDVDQLVVIARKPYRLPGTLSHKPVHTFAVWKNLIA